MVDYQDITDISSIRSATKRIELLQEVVSLNSGSTKNRSSYNKHKTRKQVLQSIRDGCRLFVAWVFSNVGICVLVVGYLLLGAIMFQEIERNDKLVTSSVVKTRQTTVGQLWNVTEKYNLLHPKNWTAEVDLIIKEYQNEIVNAESQGFDGNDIPVELWNFSGALLYSITVITTIGYGHIVPTTPIGKVVSIFYAVLGVPLFLLYLSNIGNILATSFKWTYSRICKCEIVRKKNTNER